MFNFLVIWNVFRRPKCVFKYLIQYFFQTRSEYFFRRFICNTLPNHSSDFLNTTKHKHPMKCISTEKHNAAVGWAAEWINNPHNDFPYEIKLQYSTRGILHTVCKEQNKFNKHNRDCENKKKKTIIIFAIMLIIPWFTIDDSWSSPDNTISSYPDPQYPIRVV